MNKPMPNDPKPNSQGIKPSDIELEPIFTQLDIDVASNISQEEKPGNLEEIKENNRFSIEKYRTRIISAFGALIICSQLWGLYSYKQNIDRNIKLIEQESNITTVEKVQLTDELNDKLATKNEELFKVVLGLLVGFLVGNNQENN